MGARSEVRIKERWGEIVGIYRSFLKHEGFSLSLPCVVLSENGDVFATNLSGVASHLKASSALSSPLMLECVQAADEHGGLMEAFERLIGSEDGEEFAAVWDEAQVDLKNGSRCSVDDVVDIITMAKEGLKMSPKQMICVADDGQTLEVSLVFCR